MNATRKGHRQRFVTLLENALVLMAILAELADNAVPVILIFPTVNPVIATNREVTEFLAIIKENAFAIITLTVYIVTDAEMTSIIFLFAKVRTIWIIRNYFFSIFYHHFYIIFQN